MNKTQFARLHAEENGISYKQGAEEVNRVLESLESALPQVEKDENGEGSLTLTGFVQFNVKDVAEHEARNPQTGEAVTVDATTRVRASVKSRLKDSVK